MQQRSPGDVARLVTIRLPKLSLCVILHSFKRPLLLLMSSELYILLFCSPSAYSDMFVCVTVISTASTHMHVSCLTPGLPLNLLSLTTQRHGRPSPGGLITCHSSHVTLSQIQDELGSVLTLPLWTTQRAFEGCPCLIPPPHSASTARVYQPLQVRLGRLCMRKK